jgi:hypothetical protein
MSKAQENQEELINVYVHIISLTVIEEPHTGGLGPLGLLSHKNPEMSSVLCELLGYDIGAVAIFWYIAPSVGFLLLRKYLKVPSSVVGVMQQVE